MSDTTTDNTPTQDPAPEPLTGLTGAQAAIYTELVGRTEPATVAELARAAGVGNSTAGRALPLLENLGLAVRTPGGHDGPRRLPDFWYPIAPDHVVTNVVENDNAAPMPARLESHTEDAEVNAGSFASNSPEIDDSSRDETAPNTTTSDSDSDSDNIVPCTGQEADTAQDDPPHEDSHDTGTTIAEAGTAIGEDSPHNEGSANAPAARDNAEPPTAPTHPAHPVPTAEGRLAPGALRQMVIDHLQTHPGEAFTATRVSRIIEKSSGAIANALDRLVSQGIAEQVSDRPRKFRLANSAVNNT